MPWFNVDDGFAFHRKTVRAGNAAVGLWVRAGSWCAKELTDGFVPDHMVRTMGTVKQAERLVAAGLWVRDDEREGFQFHEYAEDGRNLTREVVLKKREQAAEKKRKQREGNGAKSANPQVGGSRPEGTGGGVPEGVPRGVNASPPLPSPPVTTNPPSEGAPRKRSAHTPRHGTRIPEDFVRTVITPELVRWVQNECPLIDARFHTDNFVDFWVGKTGKDATKLDWVATWRKWMRSEQQKAAERQRARQVPTGGRGAKAEGWLALGMDAAHEEARPFGVIDGGRSA